MKLLSYEHGTGPRRLGILVGDQVTEVEDLVSQFTLPAQRLARLEGCGITPAPGGMLRWLQLGAPAREVIAGKIRQRLAAGSHPALPLPTLKPRAPVARPGKVVAVGRNYADHAKETGVTPFEKPRIIFKLSSSITDPDTVVPKPTLVQKLDFEVELAVVIGEFAHNVSREDALDYVAGYTVLNDLSAREFQFDISPPQTTFAKSMDGFCPLGPWLVTPDDIPDPQNLWVRTWVNGVQMQEGHTADMLFPVRELIAYISQFMTLEPGDIIATGTPAGIGAFRTPPVWLQAGDLVRVAVSEIGTLDTRIG
jgi:2-keto-4-pentenoate hydratase/2-oxohepta-3-ene-1,7-dioic acid hydratase in catechol pathway